MHVLQPETLQRAEEVGIAVLDALFFIECPEAVVRVLAENVQDMRAEIVLHPVVVEQCVVDIEQEDDVVRLEHGPVYARFGLSQGPSRPTSSWASSGPQVPGL